MLVVRSATKVREPIIDAAVEAGRLKLVIRGGVGVDNIDVKYAESKGLKVTNTPKASSDSVAELALGHMLAMARYISIANVTMREGKWEKKSMKVWSWPARLWASSAWAVSPSPSPARLLLWA